LISKIYKNFRNSFSFKKIIFLRKKVNYFTILTNFGEFIDNLIKKNENTKYAVDKLHIAEHKGSCLTKFDPYLFPELKKAIVDIKHMN
jgi:hypothetical protein